MSYFNKIEVKNVSRDAFGRWRVSDTGNRYDIEFIYDKQPLLADEVIVGAGSVTHNATSRDLTLLAGSTTLADEGAIYSHLDVPYTAGNSQLIEITGTLDNAAKGSGTAYFFVRSTVTGSTVETVYAQSAWNDTLADMDWTTSQILVMDFQSLKVGLIRAAFSRSGEEVPFLQVANDNVRASGYWQTPTLPAFWRVVNVSTYTYLEMGYGDSLNAIGLRYRIAANATASLRAICATVKSEGGLRLLEMAGFPKSADNGITPITVSTTLVPVLSIRVAATLNSLVNRGLYIPRGYTIAGTNAMRYVVLYRPTLTGASWGAVDATHSGMEVDVAATAVSGGVVVDSDYFSTGVNQRTRVDGLLGRTLMTLGRTGTSDILTIAAIRSGASNSDTLAAIKWDEIR